MKFFDSLIFETEKLISPLPKKEFSKTVPWSDLGQNQVIMRRDTAYELEGVGFNLVTSAEVCDGVVLVGEDLGKIKDNRRFARIAVVQIEDNGDEQKAYNLIKKIDYVKYHTFPDGYMMRSTSRSHKESVRVSKKAIDDGADFCVQRVALARGKGVVIIGKGEGHIQLLGVVGSPELGDGFIGQCGVNLTRAQSLHHGLVVVESLVLSHAGLHFLQHSLEQTARQRADAFAHQVGLGVDF